MAKKIWTAMKSSAGIMVIFAGLISWSWCNIAVPKIEKIFEDKQNCINKEIMDKLNKIEKEIVEIKTELRLKREEGNK